MLKFYCSLHNILVLPLNATYIKEVYLRKTFYITIIFREKIHETDLYVWLGVVNLDSSTYLLRKISKSIPSEDYNKETHEGDIGLLKVSKRIQFQWNISPVRLPTGKEGFMKKYFIQLCIYFVKHKSFRLHFFFVIICQKLAIILFLDIKNK